MKRWREYCWLLLLLLVVGGVVMVIFLTRRAPCTGPAFYKHGAVAADSQKCSEIGRDILQQGGTAVDAAIAALLCSSMINPQSMGIGGGAIFTIYQAKTGNVTVINAREVTPKRLPNGFFSHCSNFQNRRAQWIGVPGEIQGYWTAHQRFGRLPWRSLFEPSIKLAREGFKLPTVLEMFLTHTSIKKMMINSSLRTLFYNSDNQPIKMVHYPQLAETLEIIAQEGPEAFYNGQITRDLIKDIRNASEGGSNSLTEEDFRQYKALVVQPLRVTLGEYTMYTPPAPSRGAIISFMLKVLQGFNFTPQSMKQNQRVYTYHRILEAMKFANGQLNNINASNVPLILSDGFAQRIRRLINNRTHEPAYYSIKHHIRETYGTSHVSVVDRQANAVSVTSSINYPFGSLVWSPSTGIILNNQLVDFCIHSSDTVPLNTFEATGQQPPSSMSPSILVSKDKESVMVVGAAGGTMILSAMAEVIMNKLWFGLSMEDAINQSRVLMLTNNSMVFENNFNTEVKEAMRRKGHHLVQIKRPPSVVQGIFRVHGCIEAMSDRRKFSKAAGY
ncbi:glutathione hydrolase 5 proenzyme-like [Narcine bancroftii]|uniref:glutathione hydrolase 5 proenzyme-like n=1 Tax=Narcine bancroftii TaxID=1343680 RepID=UPI00383136AC